MPYHHDIFTVLIPDGEKNFTAPVINCLSQVPGLKVHIISESHLAPSRFSRHIQNYKFIRSIQDPKEWVERIGKIAINSGVDVILPVDQPAIRALSQYQDLIPNPLRVVPLPQLEQFDIAADKWRLTGHLLKNNLPAPSTILYQHNESFEKELSSISFPVLTKPVDGNGGQGILYWEYKIDLMAYLEKFGKPDRIIIQRFIHGHYADCSVLCKNGRILARTAQTGLLPPRYRFLHTEDIQMIKEDGIFEIVKHLIASLNWSGIAHIDLCYDERDGQYKILEINPRFWGTILGSLKVGVNFPYLACLAGMGIEFPMPGYHEAPFLGGVGAIRILTRRGLPKTTEPLQIKDTIIPYFLSDPVPQLIRWFVKYFNRIFKHDT